MSRDVQGGAQLAIAAAAVLVTSGSEKPLPPHAFGPEIEPVVDLALPLSEVFNQHSSANQLCVQWVQVSLLKQRRAHVSWSIPVMLPKLFPTYFVSVSMTQPGKGAVGLGHLRIQIHQLQEWQLQIQTQLVVVEGVVILLVTGVMVEM